MTIFLVLVAVILLMAGGFYINEFVYGETAVCFGIILFVVVVCLLGMAAGSMSA
jgi:hypothetical protein